MSLDTLYDKVRQTLPRSIRGKLRLFEEMRISKYSGEIDSQDYKIKKEFIDDIGYALKSQIAKRMFWLTLISTLAAIASIAILVIKIIN